MALNFSEFLENIVKPQYQSEGKKPTCPKGFTWDEKVGACVPSSKTAKGSEGEKQIPSGAMYNVWGTHGLNGDRPAIATDDGGDSVEMGEETDTSKWPSIKDAKPKKETKVKYDKDMKVMAPSIKETMMYHKTQKDEKRQEDAARKHREDDNRMRYGKSGRPPETKLRPGEVRRWDKNLKRYVSNKENS